MSGAATVSRVVEDSTGNTAQIEAQIEQLLPRLRLAVVFGGDKSAAGGVLYPCRNTRSWKSYESVAADIAASLRRIGFRHVHLMPEDMHLGDRLRRERIHMAWLNSGGVQGYDPIAHAPALLEMLGVPYVGHSPLTVTTLDNKHAFKREALCAGLPTAPFATWLGARGRFHPDRNSRFRHAFGDYPGPFIVKPVSGRASLHVHFVDDKAALPEAVDKVYRATENVVLIEQYLAGREFCIAVAGPVTSRNRRIVRGRDPFTFAALERVLATDERIFTSMDVRPITPDRCRPLDPGRDADLLKRMRRIACEVFLEFNLGSIVRLDLRADEAGKLFILEANPKPDLKHPAANVTSLIVAGLSEVGMDYDDLILSLLADRLDFLLTHRRENVRHILDLIDLAACSLQDAPCTYRFDRQLPTAAEIYRSADAEAAMAEANRIAVDALAAEAAGGSGGQDVIRRINDVATEASLRALDALSGQPAARKQLRTGS